MPPTLDGKVAIGTGGASGLGLGIVRRFVDAGASAVIADIDAAGRQLAGECGGRARFERVDVDLSDFAKVMSVNVLGVMLGTREAARYMADHDGGSIINVASIGGLQAGGGVMTYRASKAAVIHFSRSVATELAPPGHQRQLPCARRGSDAHPRVFRPGPGPGSRRQIRAEDAREDTQRPPVAAGGDPRGRRRGRAALRRRHPHRRHGAGSRRRNLGPRVCVRTPPVRE